MDRDELAQKVVNSRFDYGRSVLPEGCKIVVSELDRDIADAALAYFREYLGRDDVVERAADAMAPLVNEDMCSTMRKAWTSDLARAALASIGGQDGR